MPASAPVMASFRTSPAFRTPLHAQGCGARVRAGSPPGGPASAHDLHDDHPLTRTVVEVNQNHLLPSPQCKPSFTHRDRLGRPDDRRLYVGVRVRVVVHAVVLVVAL